MGYWFFKTEIKNTTAIRSCLSPSLLHSDYTYIICLLHLLRCFPPFALSLSLAYTIFAYLYFLFGFVFFFFVLSFNATFLLLRLICLLLLLFFNNIEKKKSKATFIYTRKTMHLYSPERERERGINSGVLCVCEAKILRLIILILYYFLEM